jgi:hypothetical protein
VRIYGNDEGIRRSVIVDVSDGSVVERVGKDDGEGFTAYSFYDEIAEPQREVRLRRFAQADREMDLLQREGPELFGEGRLDQIAKIRELLVPRSLGLLDKISLYSSRVLKYGPRCQPHDCFQLYGQQTNVFCAVATGQMILDFYRWNLTQAQIAHRCGRHHQSQSGHRLSVALESDACRNLRRKRRLGGSQSRNRRQPTTQERHPGPRTCLRRLEAAELLAGRRCPKALAAHLRRPVRGRKNRVGRLGCRRAYQLYHRPAPNHDVQLTNVAFQ